MKTLSFLLSLALLFAVSLYIGTDFFVQQIAENDSTTQITNSDKRQTRWLLFAIIGLIAAFVVSRIMKRKKKSH